MYKSLPELFFDTIQEKCAFLVSEYGFNGPYSNLASKDSYVILVWYTKKNLAIEFHFEIRDEDIGCYIARLANGERPEGWLMNDRGEKIRIRLSQWVRGVSDQKNLFTKVTGLSLEERIPIQISDYINLLRKYGQAFLEDRPDIFLQRN